MVKYMFKILDTKGETYVIEGKAHSANWRVLIAKKKIWRPITRIEVITGWWWNRRVTNKLVAEKKVVRRDFKPGTEIEITKTGQLIISSP